MWFVQKLVLFVTIFSFLTGCVQKTAPVNPPTEKQTLRAAETNEFIEDAENSIKTYALHDDRTEFMPQIILNESDKTFFFSCDVLSSYLASGTYTENNGQLKFITDDGNYCYTFDIIDDVTLKFNQKKSSDIEEFMGSGIEDGAEFIIESTSTHK